MNYAEQILDLFQGLKDAATLSEQNSPSLRPLFLPDLTIWYSWHRKQGTLPEEIKNLSLEDTCRALEVPIWNTCSPWTAESSKVEVERSSEPGKKIVSYRYEGKSLQAVWTKGPDGDWWQTEYPVKTAADLEAIRAYVESRTFSLQVDKVKNLQKLAGDDGIVAPQLPSRAFSWLMLDILGWSDGLMVLMDAEEEITELVRVAESQIQQFARELVQELSGEGFKVFLSPDNLDGMFISPPYFETYLQEGYKAAADMLHEYDSFLMVHGGGPLGRILEQISRSGIDCLAGVCGPPQGDTPLEDARKVVEERTVLWGGIPQDYLMDFEPEQSFEEQTRKIIEDFRKDNLGILGIADHVSIDTNFSRLKKTIDMIKE